MTSTAFHKNIHSQSTPLFRKIEKMQNLNQRAYIQTRVRLGITATRIHQELVSAYGASALQYRTVAKWAQRFHSGREELEDDPRCGRPASAVSDANIQIISDLIKEDPYVTYNEIEATTSISRGSIFNILHDVLRLRKVASRYVPHNLSDNHREMRVNYCLENLSIYRDGPGRLYDILTGDEVFIYQRNLGRKQNNSSWIGEGESARTIVRQSRFDAKTLFCIFFRSSGPVLVHPVKSRQSIDNDYYIKNCLTPAFEAIIEDRPKSGLKGICLLHDNARPHVHQNVDNFLTANRIKLIKHPPYSPDLAPCDFWLFDLIKRNLDDQPDEESLVRAVRMIVESVPVQEYKKTFDKWIERMELCVQNKGDYFEHLIK